MSSDNTKKDKSFSAGENGNITNGQSAAQDNGKGENENIEYALEDEKIPDTGFIDENSSIFTAPTIKPPKKKKNSKKSRIIKLIIAIIVMLALVAAAVGIVLIFGESGGEDVSSSSSSGSSISLKAVSTSDISRVEVHNQYGSYVISAAGDNSSEESDSDNSSGSQFFQLL